MFLIPYSTDVHDGRIRLAALEIIGLCFLIHIFVSVDAQRVRKNVTRATQEWQDEQIKNIYNNDISAYEELVNGYASGKPPKSYESLLERIKEVRKNSLMYRLGLVLDDFKPHSLFTSMFTHAGWLHLFGNMILFYVCGLAMEQYWGYWRFLIIYLVCGVAADAAFAATAISSGAELNGIPLVGASGAIAGIMGAFLITHSRVRVKLLFVLGFWYRRVFKLPAYVYFGFWFFQQIVATLLDTNHASGVAYTAHIGGFVTGALLGHFIKSEDEAAVVDPALARRQREREEQQKNSQFPVGFYHAPASETALRGWNDEDEPEEQQPSGHASELKGWEAFQEGNAESARHYLLEAMFCYFQDPQQYRAAIIELLGKIVKERNRLAFSQNEYYQWAKQLASLKEYKYAIICFDLAAFIDGNAHIQKNSLLESASLRMKISWQLGKVQRDMEYLLGIDPNGIAGNRARELLSELKTVYSNTPG